MAIQKGKTASRKATAAPEHERANKAAGAVAVQNKSDRKNLQAEKQTAEKSVHSNRWTYSRRGYALAQSLKQITTYKFASLITLLVFGITLALPALILFTAGSLSELSKRSVGEESLTAYLSLSVSDLDGAALAQRLDKQTGVKAARYVSRDEALAIFYEQADIGSAIEMLGENPLPGAVIIYPDPDAMSDKEIENLAQRLGQVEGIDRVQFDLRWVQRLQAVLDMIRSIGWLLAGFLTLTALLVVGNTIRLELMRRQGEREVAQLLGASNSFLNRPMLYTGALYGALGGVLACTIALLVMTWLRGPASALSALYSSSFELILPTTSQLLMLVAGTTLLGILGAAATLYRSSRQLLQTRRTGI